MNKWLISLIIVIIFAGCKKSGIDTDISPVNLNVVTFNIRYDNPADNENNWRFRKDFVAETILKLNADVIGTQEVLYTQLQDILTLMPQYTYAGVGRKDGKNAGEYSAIFYKKERFQYYNGGTFWLSETPAAIGVKGWDASLERIVTWVILKEKLTGKKIAFFNTHFDHVGIVARRESAKLLVAKISEIAPNLPVILTGDFNSIPESETIKYITDKNNPNSLVDARQKSSTVTGPNWTMHDFGKTAESERKIIDYVFVKNDVAIEKHQTIFETKGLLFLSDHNPVLVEVSVQ